MNSVSFIPHHLTMAQPSQQQQQQPMKKKTGLKERRGVLLPPLNFDEDTQLPLPLATTPTVVLKRKRPAFEYDEELLKKTFGEYQMNNVTINHNYIRRNGVELAEYTFQYLRKNFVLKLNDGGSISCFVSRNGAIALFNVRKSDYVVFNNLLKFLLCKVNVDSSKNMIVPLDPEETCFVRTDQLTTYWNLEGGRINELPRYNFEANVALKVMGLQFRKMQAVDDEAANVYEVKLLLHIDQVRVLKKEDELEDKCMFTN
jgi:hypothetical protein